jgi:hypothetical protein
MPPPFKTQAPFHSAFLKSLRASVRNRFAPSGDVGCLAARLGVPQRHQLLHRHRDPLPRFWGPNRPALRPRAHGETQHACSSGTGVFAPSARAF